MAEQVTEQQVLDVARRAKEAAVQLAPLTRESKDRALLAMADGLLAASEDILAANAQDVAAARAAGEAEPASEHRRRSRGASTSAGARSMTQRAGDERSREERLTLIDRLALDEARIEAMADGLRQVAALPDPVGEVVRGYVRPNGLQISQVRVPFGVVAMVYEARPNVTVDAAGLAIKSGNCALLRGSATAVQSNRALVSVLAESAEKAGLPTDCIQLVPGTDRSSVGYLLRARGLVDVVIPRGGAGLISYVVENSSVPVIETGVGNVHVYVDAEADLAMAERIVLNAKLSRPSVCNAAESLLVHRDVAAEFVPRIAALLAEHGVLVHGDPVFARYPGVQPANEQDWAREYLDLQIAARVVSGLDEAIEHIRRWSSGHTEAIVTANLETARRFVAQVDAAAVLVNASTRFTDGAEFGFGAEIGISTQKLHARGPMGLPELTSTKWVVYGSGQIR